MPPPAVERSFQCMHQFKEDETPKGHGPQFHVSMESLVAKSACQNTRKIIYFFKLDPIVQPHFCRILGYPRLQC